MYLMKPLERLKQCETSESLGSVLMGGLGMEIRAFVKNDAFAGDYSNR